MTATAVKGKGKVDIHGRDEDHRAADKWFEKEYEAIRGKAGSVGPADPKRYGYATKGAFLTITRVRGEESSAEKVELIPALYDLSVLQTLATELGKAKVPAEELRQKLHRDASVKYGVAIASESEHSIGRKQSVPLAPDAKGYVLTPGIEQPILGTAVLFEGDGKYAFGSLDSKKAYLEWLPAIQSGWHLHNHWCIDLPSERVADLADRTGEMLEQLNNQIKNLHGVSIYMIQPRWLRYYSDGDMGSQRSAAYGLRNASMPQGGVRPLLYDAPAWVVGLRMGSRMVPGRVFITPEGRFIGSDWCQREADKNGGIDLHTGEFTKHTLMSWCAGPGISKFGDDVIKARHGSLRRAVVQKTQPGALEVGQIIARKRLLGLLVRAKSKEGELALSGVNPEATQRDSLRFFAVGVNVGHNPEWENWQDGEEANLIGFSARFGKYTYTVTVPLNPKHGTIDPRGANFSKTAIMTQQQHYQLQHAVYAIGNDALAKEIVAAMKEAI
jgi:hypothetical protein